MKYRILNKCDDQIGTVKRDKGGYYHLKTNQISYSFATLKSLIDYLNITNLRID